MWHLVMISESSGWGLGEAFASQIEKDAGVKVVLDDFAIGNLSAGEVLQVLQTGKGTTSRLEELPVALQRADLVVMFGNPMLSVDDATGESINSCFGSVAPAPCTPQAFEKYTADLEAIWAKVFELRSGQPTVLRAIDVASPFVNDWKEYQTFDACTVCWECVSNAVRQAAEAYRIPVKLVINKFDTLDEEDKEYAEALIHLYGTIGYPSFRVSALTGEGIKELQEDINGKITLLSGHSGVGKSTLINALIPGVKARTGDISGYHHKGMHTTTFSEMFEVPTGGYIIDTPGIKGFGTIDFKQEEVAHYFPEIFKVSEGCKFNNCTHRHEPGCAVLEAVEKHYISESRYQSYLNILEDGEETKYRSKL